MSFPESTSFPLTTLARITAETEPEVRVGVREPGRSQAAIELGDDSMVVLVLDGLSGKELGSREPGLTADPPT